MRLFETRLPEKEASEEFRDLRDASGYKAGRELMERVFAEYPGPRQEFVKDFQGRGFSARIWELALFAWLRERDGAVRIWPRSA